MYGENSAYLTSGIGGGGAGLALAATTGINTIAAILVVVTMIFSVMLVSRITRRALRRH